MPVTHFVLLLLMFLPSLRQSPAAQSQTSSEKQRAATISGRVILNGELLGRAAIQFLQQRGSVQTGREEPLRAVADQQGRYRITATPAGSYHADILRAEAMKTYNIKGRVVNAETGNPVEGIEIEYTGGQKESGVLLASAQPARSKADGKFQFHDVLPGKYKIYLAKGGTNEYFSEPALCEITDGDVDGVEVKLQPGGSISGQAVIEGATDPLALAALAKSSQILIECVSQDTEGVVFQRKTTRVKADGSFRIAGLQPGRIYLSSAQRLSSGVLWIKRVELGGQGERITREGLELGPGENLSNVRVILSYGRITLRGITLHGITLRGEVKIIGGDLPPHLGIYPYIYRLNKSKSESESGKAQSAFVDARGQFAFSNLIPGEYEIRLGLAVLQPSKLVDPMNNAISKLILNTRQKISIGGDGSGSGTGDATVTITIDLSQKEGN
ncbi:MAG TPA: carboxypeptidase regulatory-like domain-containing protein [Blastocatellia bacterium]|nr:carboxypeptidase regulatory-like domain-containing protein [Blastocatellia bacterium]